jgi:TetR/AcrR family transcriptional regulator, regulator of cefoperazone and chloramphenicol sensitivity
MPSNPVSAQTTAPPRPPPAQAGAIGPAAAAGSSAPSGAPASPGAGGPAAPSAAAEDARQRLLLAGLRLFAQQGYANTSTRELAEAASVNVAAISYYFGDKAGLYRAVFFEPANGRSIEEETAFVAPGLTLAEALRGFYAGFVLPLQQGDLVRLCMKLHFREFLEPTGLWEEHLAHGIRPVHEALTTVLCRHFGLAESDDDLQRLVISLAALGVHLHVGYDINEQLAPGVTRGAAALDLWADRLALFGCAMVQAEARRRGLDPAAFGACP